MTQCGDATDAIDTPALVIDLDAMQRNLQRMAAFASDRNLRLRPHAKMHKSAIIAKLQIEAGAVGVCVQKVEEAESLAAGGVHDIFISNEVIAPHKLARLAALAKRIRIAVAVDSELGVQRLAQALQCAGATADCFVEVDVGQGRCGVAPAAAGALALQVTAAGLHLAGLQAYHGTAQHLRTAAQSGAAIETAVALARAAQASLLAAGLVCPLVTGAGTGSFEFEAASGVFGELQCGSYLFMDRDYAENQVSPGAPRFEHALFVKSQVMSRAVSHAVIDAGHKAYAVDSGPPRVWGRELEFAGCSDEHGVLRARGDALPELGESIWLVPGHCDPTVNLHDRYVVVRGGLAHGQVEALWRVDARGAMA
ncbi:MAG: DSD1 family PLP-dependent enzyme [Burkholderiales bacterium]|nr:DSD1 family PLP-dependent enzyme [Burkholderiales bacterium]